MGMYKAGEAYDTVDGETVRVMSIVGEGDNWDRLKCSDGIYRHNTKLGRYGKITGHRNGVVNPKDFLVLKPSFWKRLKIWWFRRHMCSLRGHDWTGGFWGFEYRIYCRRKNCKHLLTNRDCANGEPKRYYLPRGHINRERDGLMYEAKK